jgi:hypothetical protein
LGDHTDHTNYFDRLKLRKIQYCELARRIRESLAGFGTLISPEEFDRFQHQSLEYVRSEIRDGEADIAYIAIDSPVRSVNFISELMDQAYFNFGF